MPANGLPGARSAPLAAAVRQDGGNIVGGMRLAAVAAYREYELFTAGRRCSLLVTLLALLVCAPSAVAGTASVVTVEPDISDPDGEVSHVATFEASPGERNRVSVLLAGNRYTITDNGPSVQAGARCRQVSPQQASCPVIGNEEIDVKGGDQDDEIAVEAPAAYVSISGGEGSDTIRLIGGTNGFVSGDPGDDVIYGDGGSAADDDGFDDTLSGGSGNDRVSGGAERDRLQGDDDDSADGPDGDDILSGGDGSDSMDGDGGDDRLSGGPGVDSEIGGVGNDTVLGGPGQDDLKGGNRLSPERGALTDNDFLNGGSGPDLLAGGAGGDRLAGGSGVDAADYEGADLFGQGSSPRLTIRLDGEANDGLDGEGDSVEADVERAIWRAESTFALAGNGLWLLRERLSFRSARSVGAEILLLSTDEAADPPTSGIFLGGPFTLLAQSSRDAVAEVALSGDQMLRCPKARPRRQGARPARRLSRYLRTLIAQRTESSRARASRRARPRRSFRVKGRLSSATALTAAEWSTTDTCRGTITTVQKGTVLVEDLARDRTQRLAAGDRYVARPRR